MPITPVPNPLPTRTMSQNVFDAAMANLMVYIPLMISDIVAMQTDVAAKQSTASAAAGTATTQAGLATSNGATQVGLAANQVTLAANQVTLAANQVALATGKANLTAADRTQTGLDRTQTGLDRVATGQALLDMIALYDQFDDRYLGVKAADPVLDNDGNALQSGAFYISSATGFLRAYTTGFGWVQGISSVSGVSAINGLTGSVALKTFNGAALTGIGDIAAPSTPDFLLINQGVI